MARRQVYGAGFQAIGPMGDGSRPLSIVKSLVRGDPPPRPLWIPLAFSVAARVENLGLASFVGNPTKIANALRQVRSALRLDGVTCYSNPYLEIEALGAKVAWNNDDVELVQAPSLSYINEQRDRGDSAETILQKGGVPVAQEVLKRLNIMLKGESALMVTVNGPLKLVSQLAGTSAREASEPGLVQFAAEIVATLSKHFVDAGADIVLVMEDVSSAHAENMETWTSLLEPAINVVRFYEALPMLLLGTKTDLHVAKAILKRDWDCVICLPVRAYHAIDVADLSGKLLGLALPVSLFSDAGEEQDGEVSGIRRAIDDIKPVLLTTAGDIPASADLKKIGSVFDKLQLASKK